MDYHYTDYIITQEGTNLTTDSAIKLQKMENKVTRFIFKLEDWLPETARLYVAFLNPETKRYHYEPLLNNGEDYYYVVGTKLSYYPSKHKMLLIGVTPSFILDDNVILDITNTVYVSREFNKIVVIDNFISDEARELSYPNIEYALDDFMSIYNTNIMLSIQTADDATKCDEDIKRCEEILVTCTEIQEECDADVGTCSNAVITCTELEEQCRQDNEEASEILAQNRETLVSCNTILNQAQQSFDSCIVQAQNAANSASSANAASNNASSTLTQCRNMLTQCQQVLTQVNQMVATLQTNYDTYLSQMRQEYETMMENLRNAGGGEP